MCVSCCRLWGFLVISKIVVLSETTSGVGVVAVEMGDPVVCTLVLVRDISLFSLSLSGPGTCYRDDRQASNTNHKSCMYCKYI